MKVLHLTGDTEDSGGVLSVLRALDAEFAANEIKQSVWVNHAYKERRLPRLDYRRSANAWGFHPSHMRLFWAALRSHFDLKKLLHEEHFDVLHAHSQGTVLVAAFMNRLWKRPVVFTNHAYATRRGLYRVLGRLPGFHNVSLTPNMARYYKMPPPERDTWWIVSECCAPEFFSVPTVSGHAHQDGRLRLVGMGTLMRWKRWHLVIEAIRYLEPKDRERLQFDLWGGRSRVGDSEEYADELKLAFADAGVANVARLQGPTSDVIGKLRESDWFLLPSTNEPCSVALIEALAMGVPAVVSASGGNVDIIQNGSNGRLFKPDDPESLAAVLRELLHSPRPQFSPEEIRESVRERSSTTIAKQYMQIYRRIADNSACSRSA